MSDSRKSGKPGVKKPWQQQQPQQLPQYTLPGVINYLTSEFTNLERFKIMTNLEKSEMKYRIVQLQGEVNSLKFLNNKQAAKIERLEAELQKNGVKNDVNINGIESDFTPSFDPSIPLNLPEIDLSIVKKSREQLTKSMKEIMQLLKPPSITSINSLNLPDDDSTNNKFDELLNYEPELDDKFEFENKDRDRNASTFDFEKTSFDLDNRNRSNGFGATSDFNSINDEKSIEEFDIKSNTLPEIDLKLTPEIKNEIRSDSEMVNQKEGDQTDDKVNSQIDKLDNNPKLDTGSDMWQSLKQIALERDTKQESLESDTETITSESEVSDLEDRFDSLDIPDESVKNVTQLQNQPKAKKVNKKNKKSKLNS